MNGRLFAVLLLVTLPGAAQAMGTSNGAQSEQQLQVAAESIATKMIAAWNAHDMTAWGQRFTTDVDFVNVVGVHWKGRDELVAAHVESHKAQFKNSILVTHSVEAQLLSPEFGLVHVNWGISGDLDPDGTARQPRDGIVSWLLVKQTDGSWLIRNAHNTNIRKP